MIYCGGTIILWVTFASHDIRFTEKGSEITKTVEYKLVLIQNLQVSIKLIITRPLTTWRHCESLHKTKSTKQYLHQLNIATIIVISSYC